MAFWKSKLTALVVEADMGLEQGTDWEEVKQTVTFQDLMKFGEFMPAGEKEYEPEAGKT
jgi:hypothetical protein